MRMRAILGLVMLATASAAVAQTGAPVPPPAPRMAQGNERQQMPNLPLVRPTAPLARPTAPLARPAAPQVVRQPMPSAPMAAPPARTATPVERRLTAQGRPEISAVPPPPRRIDDRRVEDRRDDRRDDRQSMEMRREYDRHDRWSDGDRQPSNHARGGTMPRFWFDPRYQVHNWQDYGLARPGDRERWVRNYDDAVLIDQDGRVIDTAEAIDWDSFGDDRYAARDGAYGYQGDQGYQGDRACCGQSWQQGWQGGTYYAAPGSTITIQSGGAVTTTTTTTTTYVDEPVRSWKPRAKPKRVWKPKPRCVCTWR
jgi:Ni/Co efflux regulator RcnB